MMRFAAIRKWLYFIGSSACLLQSTGCPDAGDIRTSAASSAASFVTGLVNSSVSAAVNAAFGL